MSRCSNYCSLFFFKLSLLMEVQWSRQSACSAQVKVLSLYTAKPFCFSRLANVLLWKNQDPWSWFLIQGLLVSISRMFSEASLDQPCQSCYWIGSIWYCFLSNHLTFQEEHELLAHCARLFFLVTLPET